MGFFENTRKPNGLGGRLMVGLMNLGHRGLADWGFRFLSLPKNATVLDCGCGGGANLRQLLKSAGHVCGVDYSPVSVEKSRRLNQQGIASGRCEVFQANVQALPFRNQQFDAVTAFETVYFWADLLSCFREVARVLKAGGTFLICNECGGEKKQDEKWTKRIPGMTIVQVAQLQSVLEHAGFEQVEIHKSNKGWLCMTARKKAE